MNFFSLPQYTILLLSGSGSWGVKASDWKDVSSNSSTAKEKLLDLHETLLNLFNLDAREASTKWKRSRNSICFTY